MSVRCRTLTPRLRCLARVCRVQLSSDRGTSVVEFVMMVILLVGLLMAVLQVAVYMYIRNIVGASAAAGARYAANAGVDVRQGGPRASEALRAGLSPSAARRIPCTGREIVDAASGLAVATVRCHGAPRMVWLPLTVPLSIDVTAAVLKEAEP